MTIDRTDLRSPKSNPKFRLDVFATCLVAVAMAFNSWQASASEFLDAVRQGNVARVKALVEADPDLVNQTVKGSPPLRTAVVNCHVEVATFLLEHGAEVNRPSGSYKQTAIFEAQTAEMAQLLIDHGADVHVKGKHYTPLQEAIRGRYVRVVDVLLDAGATLDFDMAVELGRTGRVAEMLATKPWLAKPPRKPLYHSAGRGNLELTKLLLQHGADPDLDFGFSNVFGPYTPVSSAVTSGHYEIAELLLRSGASPNVSGGRNHDNLFLYAIAYRDPKFAKLMIHHGADLLAGDSWGQHVTPLHVAASLGGAPHVARAQRVGQPQSPGADEARALELVRSLIEAGADVSAQSGDGWTPLLGAAISGHLQVCKLLVVHNAEWDLGSACLLGRQDIIDQILADTPEVLNGDDQPLRTPPLHWAARSGNATAVKRFLDRGAKVDARAPELEHQDAGGYSVHSFKQTVEPTALHLAACLGHDEVVSLLLKEGADIESESGEHSRFQTAIEIAAAWGQQSTVALLLDHGAKVELSGDSALSLAEITDPSLLARLIDASALDLRGEQGTSLLALVVACENASATEFLIARGAVPEIRTACKLGRIADIRRLIKEDPTLTRVEPKARASELPIGLAVQYGHVDVVELLIKNGSDPANVEGNDATLIHQAATHGHLDVLELLVGNGLSLNATDASGSTPLHAAASGSRPQVLRYLIQHGADVNARNFDRATPLHQVSQWWTWAFDDAPDREARERRAETTAKLLLDAGAKVNVKDNRHDTPLHRAALSALTGVAEALLDHGAEVNARDCGDRTPLGRSNGPFWMTTSKSDQSRMQILLRQHGGTR